MAQVNIEDVIDHLQSEMRRALEEALKETVPGAKVDSYELFRAFRRAVRHKCSTWETVPEQYVRK